MRMIVAAAGVVLAMSWGYSSASGAATTEPSERNPMPAVAAPVIPDKTFDLKDFGAVGDGKTMNTAAIKKAIAACEKAGGGKVVVPSGKYLTGPFALTSNLDLDLEAGATILISDNRKDYQLQKAWYESCIVATGCHDFSVTGSGTIDGQGKSWWAEFQINAKMPHRPYLLRFDNCQRVAVRGVTLTDSPMFHLVLRYCQDVTIDGITINAPANSKNTDGIDPSGFNYLITHCTIDTGDDCIAVKPDQVDPKRPSVENMLITDCTFKHGHGMSVGGQTNGGMRNMLVKNCTFDGTEAGIRLKAPRGKGGTVENLTYENLSMKNVKWAISITSYYPESTAPSNLGQATKEAVTPTTPIWRNIWIKHINATDCANAGRIIGLPEMPVTDMELDDVNISADKPFVISQANDIRFRDSSIQVNEGRPIKLISAQVSGIDAEKGK
jgi:polygalacturonase